jgi:hypothetical protein
VDNEAILNIVVSGSLYGLHICFNLSSRSKELYGSMVMGVIFYSSSFYVLSIWECWKLITPGFRSHCIRVGLILIVSVEVEYGNIAKIVVVRQDSRAQPNASRK